MYELEHHDLTVIPREGRRPGIFWLRFYRGDPSVAVVTNIPGDPSYSLTNWISLVATVIAERFAVPLDSLIFFEVRPRRDSMAAEVRRVTFTGDDEEHAAGYRKEWEPPQAEDFTGRPEWWSSSREEIERIVGARLLGLPSHDDLYTRVLEVGGGTTDERWRRVFEPIDVANLPPPHNPAGCFWRHRFDEIVDRYKEEGGDDRLEPGRRFLATLTPADRAKCPYHRGNWKAIANASARIINEVGVADSDEYLAATDKKWMRRRDRRWLRSLFFDAIDISANAYTNGQHRGCALRFSGAAQAAVVTRDEFVCEYSTDWTFVGEW